MRNETETPMWKDMEFMKGLCDLVCECDQPGYQKGQGMEIRPLSFDEFANKYRNERLTLYDMIPPFEVFCAFWALQPIQSLIWTVEASRNYPMAMSEKNQDKALQSS